MVDAQLVPHALEERDEHIAHHAGVVAGPVVVEGGQIKMLRHDVQLVFAQLRQQILGQNEGVHVGGMEVQTRLTAAGTDEADVELRVVGRQGPAGHKVQEAAKGLGGLGGVGEHGVGDARQADDLRRQAAAGIHKGLEAVGNLPIFQHHGADFGDGLGGDVQAGGLNVEADDFILKGLVLGAVDHDPVVQIVDEVAFNAVKYFYFTLGGMPGIREGLAHAVVGDGDGGMAPGHGLLDDAGGIGKGVHIAHLGMEVQLHALLGIVVRPGRVGDFHDILGAKLHILAVAAQLQIALHPNPHAHGKGAAQGLSLLFLGV